MSEKLVRFKHKKDVINCVEGSWDYCGKEDEQRKVIKELKNVYKIASSAKNNPKSEYEAKAKAYNDTLKTLDKLIDNDERYKEARSNDFVAGMLLAYENIFYLMEDYIKESGEYDAKK